jgi:hypothetical protein
MTNNNVSDSANVPKNIDQSTDKRKVHFSIWNTFKHHIPHLLLTIFFDIIFPLIIYFLLQKRLKPVYALLISGTPPLFMVMIKAILSRTFDALGFLVFIGFVMSALVALLTHNPIILLLEKSIITAILSVVFGVTLIPCHCCHDRYQLRPLAYYFYQDLVPTRCIEVGLPNSIFVDEHATVDNQLSQRVNTSQNELSSKQEVTQVYEWIYRHCSSFRSACYTITSIWSVGYLLEFLARVILILIQMPVTKIFIYGHIILTSITILCIAFTILFISTERPRTLTFIEQWNDEHSTMASL